MSQYYELGVTCLSIDEVKDLWKKNTEKFKIIYAPLDVEEEFEEICELVYLCGDLTFVVEEMDTFSRQGVPVGDNYKNVIQRGRHKNIEMIGISQRPFGIPRIITAQAKEIYSFIQKEPRDIAYLKDYIGEEADKIPLLEKYNYLHYNNGECKIEKC